MDDDFVIVQAVAEVDGHNERRIWIYSRRTLSYTHAFGSFVVPIDSMSIMLYENFERILHIVHSTKYLNVRLGLPYLIITPNDKSKAGDK